MLLILSKLVSFAVVCKLQESVCREDEESDERSIGISQGT